MYDPLNVFTCIIIIKLCIIKKLSLLLQIKTVSK